MDKIPEPILYAVIGGAGYLTKIAVDSLIKIWKTKVGLQKEEQDSVIAVSSKGYELVLARLDRTCEELKADLKNAYAKMDEMQKEHKAEIEKIRHDHEKKIESITHDHADCLQTQANLQAQVTQLQREVRGRHRP